VVGGVPEWKSVTSTELKYLSSIDGMKPIVRSANVYYV
jgi:hypothetical protein